MPIAPPTLCGILPPLETYGSGNLALAPRTTMMARKRTPTAPTAPATPPPTPTLRNRIVGHRQVRAADLIPHELNPRTHSEAQRTALNALLGEVGYARSVLAYVADADRAAALATLEGSPFARDPKTVEAVLESARLTLIDGHLRREELAGTNELVEVEVLDVTDDEARKLLLSIDPLAALAGYDGDVLAQLQRTVETDDANLRSLWDTIGQANTAVDDALASVTAEDEGATGPRNQADDPGEQFLVIVTCSDETQQKALLIFLQGEGYECRAPMA